MRLVVILILSLLLSACGEGGDQPTSEPPTDDGGGGGTTCDLPLSSGFWAVEYTTLDGNCGDIADVVVNFSQGPEGCVILDEDLSSDRCELGRTVQCSDGNLHWEQSSYVEQVDYDYLMGVMTINATDGYASCVGTYRIDAYLL